MQPHFHYFPLSSLLQILPLHPQAMWMMCYVISHPERDVAVVFPQAPFRVTNAPGHASVGIIQLRNCTLASWGGSRRSLCYSVWVPHLYKIFLGRQQKSLVGFKRTNWHPFDNGTSQCAVATFLFFSFSPKATWALQCTMGMKLLTASIKVFCCIVACIL